MSVEIPTIEMLTEDTGITVDEIKQQNNDYLSFVVRGTENWTNANSKSKYYNLKESGNRALRDKRQEKLSHLFEKN